jgi:hypothetical protein
VSEPLSDAQQGVLTFLERAIELTTLLNDDAIMSAILTTIETSDVVRDAVYGFCNAARWLNMTAAVRQ